MGLKRSQEPKPGSRRRGAATSKQLGRLANLGADTLRLSAGLNEEDAADLIDQYDKAERRGKREFTLVIFGLLGVIVLISTLSGLLHDSDPDNGISAQEWLALPPDSPLHAIRESPFEISPLEALIALDYVKDAVADDEVPEIYVSDAFFDLSQSEQALAIRLVFHQFFGNGDGHLRILSYPDGDSYGTFSTSDFRP